MTQKTAVKGTQIALWFLPIVIALAAFIAAMQWAKHQNPVIAEALTLAFGVVVLGQSLFIGHRVSRGLDEVQAAQQRFAHATGWVWGGFIAVLLLFVHPVMNGLIELVNAVVHLHASESSDLTNRRALTVAFIFGAGLVMVMQALAIIIAAMIWDRRMKGTGDAS